MEEFKDLQKAFQIMKQEHLKVLDKLKEIDPKLFNEISNDLSIIEKTKDISEIQKIQHKYASFNK